MTKTVIRILTVVWALFIAIAAIVRGYSVGAILQTIGPGHVVAHMGVFSVLGVLIVFSFDTPRGRSLSLLAGITLGIASELYEAFAFHGSIEYIDILLDTSGVILGAVTVLLKRAASKQLATQFNQRNSRVR